MLKQANLVDEVSSNCRDAAVFLQKYENISFSKSPSRRFFLILQLHSSAEGLKGVSGWVYLYGKERLSDACL